MSYRTTEDYAKEIEALKDDPNFLKDEIELIEGERRAAEARVRELEEQLEASTTIGVCEVCKEKLLAENEDLKGRLAQVGQWEAGK